jgi:O-methyltransferase
MKQFIKILLSLFYPVYWITYKFLNSDYFTLSREAQAFYRVLTPPPKLHILEKAFDFIRGSKIEGDYLEFGVWKGLSFAHAYHCIKRKELNVKCYAFDSFEGLPEIKGLDKDSEFRQGDYACSLQNFKTNLRRKKVNLNQVTIIPGFFDRSLNDDLKKKLPIKKAAIIWIDCDLYESTVPVLQFIKDYLQDGTVIMLDDWFCLKGDPNKGEQKAFSEWLIKNPDITATEFHKYDWRGNSFLIHYVR